MIPPQNYIM